MSLIRSLEMGKRALAAHQAAISTAGHNISNLSTPGYARQKTLITSASVGPQANGVDQISVRQIRDQLLESRLQSETQDLSRWQAQSQWLNRVETFFMTDGEIPLNTALGRFWNSWQDLANDPNSQAAREAVHQRGETLAFEITALRQRLTEVDTQINSQVRSDIEQINSRLEGIAKLNRAITIAEADNEVANDMRDERNRMVSALSEKLNIRTMETEDHGFVLTVSGLELVRGEVASSLDADEGVENGFPKVHVSAGGKRLPVESGELAGLMEVRDTVIPDLMTQLDTMTGSLITQVNELHEGGYSPQGQTGQSFFAGTSSLDIQVTINADQIATAESQSAVTDNSVALSIAQLRVAGQVGESGMTFESYFTETVVQVGMVTQEAMQFEENQARIVDSLTQQQQSVSGVSLDEEMTSLIQFQNAYDAAARYLSTVDELLQSLIGMV